MHQVRGRLVTSTALATSTDSATDKTEYLDESQTAGSS